MGCETGVHRIEEASIIILPVPFDAGSTWLKGADKGPEAILAASPALEFYDIETRYEVFREGIFTASLVMAETPEEIVDGVYRAVRGHLDSGRFVVTIGGNHTVSIGAARAHAEAFEGISVLQLDAHTDLREEYEGSRYNHACVMARIGETCPFVQVGIRSMDSSEAAVLDEERVFYARDICRGGMRADDIVALLEQRVYITIDLDVFDPSIMPSTGTPEPGGLGWYPVLDLLRAVSRQRKVVGFDVVELCPGSERAPDFLAARLIYTLLSYIRS